MYAAANQNGSCVLTRQRIADAGGGETVDRTGERAIASIVKLGAGPRRGDERAETGNEERQVGGDAEVAERHVVSEFVHEDQQHEDDAEFPAEKETRRTKSR